MENPYLTPKSDVKIKSSENVSMPVMSLAFYILMLLVVLSLFELDTGEVTSPSTKGILQILALFLLPPVVALFFSPIFKVLTKSKFIHSYLTSLKFSSLIIGSFLLLFNLVVAVTLAIGADNVIEAIEVLTGDSK